MGIVKKALKIFSPLAALTGMADDKPSSSSASTTDTGQTDAEKQAAADKKNRQAVLAANAGSDQTALGVSNPATVTKRTLLGG